MATDLLSTALIQAMARNLSVSDLIRTADTLKSNGQAQSVERLYSTWIQHNQDHPLAYAVLFNHSVVLTDAGRLDEAQQGLEKAIALNPDFMPAYINLGRVYERKGSAGLAVVQWSMAIARMSAVHGASVEHKTTALNQSARALEHASQDESAEDMLRQSLEIDPHQREVVQHLIALRQRQCKWPVVEPNDRVKRELFMEGISPLSIAAYTDDPLFQLAVATHYNRMDVPNQPGTYFSWPRAEKKDGRLRIGYLSSDLREHAVGYLMTEIFKLHNRQQFEIFAYYCGPASKDALQKYFQDTVDHWTDIREMDDAAAARRIHEDGVQILVDLNGYTREARLKVVAHRPAPVIVNWLGFPGTMASPYHHYIVADDWIIPPESELYYSEKVLRLPCYQPNNRVRKLSELPVSREKAHLPEAAMVYCCFNGVHKLTNFTYERWLMILERVPDSVLWLLSSTDGADRRLREFAEKRGIDGERIVFAEKLANPFHLARYPLADLFLATTPYGAHTTASDALWMGVPVLTLSGRSFASRVCGSLVRSAGLPDLVTESATEFVERAVELGQDKKKLQVYREKLKLTHDTCVLFDMPLLVKKLEELYHGMWADFENGTLPRPDLSNMDVYLEVGAQVAHEELEVQTIPDYRAWWQDRLAERHRFRPITPDQRFVNDHKKFT